MMKNKSKFIILALIMLISVVGISYAFFVYYKVGDNSSQLIFGDIYLKLNDGTDSITLLNVFPETKEKARAEGRTDNIITFTVSGMNTTTNKDIWYEIMLNEGSEVEGRTRFNPEDLVFDLIEVNEDKTETYLVDAQSYSDVNARRIWVETVDRNTTTEVNKTYKLRMWLSEDVFISDTNPNATYSVGVYESSYASVKVSVYGDFKVKMSYPISLKTLVENRMVLAGADSDGTRFVTGDSSINNYVSYSGIVWRVVSVNSDGSIKMITEDMMTSMNGTSTYASSSLRTYLNDTFSSQLTNTDELLVTSKWDYTADTTADTIKPATSSYVEDKVGLLTLYEYMMAGGSDSFLTKVSDDTSGNWWTMTLNYSQTPGPGWYGWLVSSSGASTSPVSYTSWGIRPSIVLVSDIQVGDGLGTADNPYKIITGNEDITEPDDGEGGTTDPEEPVVQKNYLKRVGSEDSAFWSDTIVDNYYLVSSDTISFISLSDSEASSRCSSATYCENVSATGGGTVRVWFEEKDNSHYDMYVVSDGITVFPADCSWMFYGADDYTYSISFENVDTSNVTSMEGMFYGCLYLGYSGYIDNYILDLSSFDTSNVTSMHRMFSDCSWLESIDLSSFDTSNVTDMTYMFYDCNSLIELDLSHFNTTGITSIGYMFYYCESLKLLDLSSFTLNKMSGSSIFVNASSTATVYVGSQADQEWILALASTDNRPSEWSTSNVLIKE